MALKDRDRFREIIDSIDVSDFDFAEIKCNGEIKAYQIKVSDFIDKDNKKKHRVIIPRVTVSEFVWYSEAIDHYKDVLFYDEIKNMIEKYYLSLTFSFDLSDDKYNNFKGKIENVKFIETMACIMSATFSNTEKLNSIKELKLFNSFSDRLYWGLKGLTGEMFITSRMTAPIFIERNKCLDLVDDLSEYTEVDKNKLVAAYKAFLHNELKHEEDTN